MKRPRFLWVSLILAFLVFSHPYILGLKGRLEENMFGNSLKPGMTREQALALARRFGYEPPGRAVFREDATGPLIVTFADFYTFCITGGKEYLLMFNGGRRLTSWEVNGWQSAC